MAQFIRAPVVQIIADSPCRPRGYTLFLKRIELQKGPCHKTNIFNFLAPQTELLVGNSRLSRLSTYLHIIFQFLDLAVCVCVCTLIVSAFGAIVTVYHYRSCVLNPNVRVESRSRYPNDSPCRHCKTHTRNDTLGRERNPTAVYTQPPLYTSYGHLACQSRPSAQLAILLMTSFEDQRRLG